MASPMLCLHEVEDLWDKCLTDQSLSVLELKIRWGRSFASWSLFVQWLRDCGLYGVIRSVVLGMRWTWALLLSKTCLSLCELELWCENSRDEGNIQGKSCESSVSVWSEGAPWPVLCSQAAVDGAVVVCRSPELQNWAHVIVCFDWGMLSYTVPWVVSSREIA